MAPASAPLGSALALAGPPALWIALGAILCLAGALSLLTVRAASARRSLDLADQPPAPADLALISPMTRAVAGFALIAIGYHLIMGAIGSAKMTAPLPWVVGVAASVCALSILTDVLEFRGLREAQPPEDEQP